MKPSAPDMLAAALQYADKGLPVFPLLPNAKVPYKGSNGVHDATTSKLQIKTWWTQTPKANIGLATGKVSGIFALDVDLQSGGIRSLAAPVQQHGPLPRTPQQTTPSGGMHYAFKHPGFKVKNSQSEIAEGLDIRGDGGYIVAAPSQWRGKAYGWRIAPWSVSFADAPGWLLDAIRPSENGTESADAISVLSVLSVPSVDDAIRLTLPIDTGQRHRCIFNYARALKAMPQYAEQQAQALRELVRQWWAQALPSIRTKEFEETWCDFLSAWPRVRMPLGVGPMSDALEKARKAKAPQCAKQYESDNVILLVKLCRELQRLAGDAPFYLSARIAGDAIGVERMQAHRYLHMLVVDGVLRVAEPGTKTRATRYRFTK
jgi:hypothetical protein